MPANFDPTQFRPRQPTVRVTIIIEPDPNQEQVRVIVGYTRLSILSERLDWYPSVKALDAAQMERVKELEEAEDTAWLAQQELYTKSLQPEIEAEKKLTVQSQRAQEEATQLERRKLFLQAEQQRLLHAAKANGTTKRSAEPSAAQPAVKKVPTMPTPPAAITETGHTAWAPAFGRMNMSLQIRGDSYSNQDFTHQATTGLRALGCPNAANPHHLCTPTCELRYGFGTPMALLCPEQLQLEALEQDIASAEPKTRDEIKTMMSNALMLQAQITGTKAELHALKRFLPQQLQ
jgi:hypothetical protein